jgi:hypothetical protein
MNCGLGNLDTLKRHLVPAGTMAGDTRFDQVIQDIGVGVAALFDAHCNRQFAYGDGLTQIFRGSRAHWYVRAFPVAVWTKVELRFFMADNWTNISGQPLSVNEETGLLSFGYTLGVDPIMVRATWSGGYWFEQLEPDAQGFPSAAPANVQNCTALEPAKFALPADVKLAWLLQCREVWNKIDKLGTGLVGKPDEETMTGALKLTEGTKEFLRGYVRYQAS